jgi:hypothetical protein
MTDATRTVLLTSEQTKAIADFDNQQAQTVLGDATANSMDKGQFEFFAAFDGTNNTLDNIKPKTNNQKTNVGTFLDQYSAANANNTQQYGNSPKLAIFQK